MSLDDPRASTTVTFTLDGREVSAAPGETIWQVAERQGTTIPHLCWKDALGYRADGNCRACMVEVEGERVLAASCIRRPAEGMVVRTASERAETSRRLVMELLASDMPSARDLARPRRAVLGAGGGHRPRRAALPGSRPGSGGAVPVEQRVPRRLAPLDRGQPRRLHRLRAVRAGLPRGAGQRRHRHGASRRRDGARLRHRRPDGALHLRGLRRVRPGLPHRRADGAHADGRGGRAPRGRGRPGGAVAVPLLRRRLPDRGASEAARRSSRSTAARAPPTAASSASRAASGWTT